MTHRNGITYLTVVPDHRGVNKLRVVKATSGPPIVNLPDAIVVKVSVVVDKDAFEPPAVEVYVRAEDVIPNAHLYPEPHTPEEDTDD